MFLTLKNAFAEKGIRKKLLMTLLLLLIFRLGSFIPIPGLSPSAFGNLATNDFFSVMSTITGGNLEQGTLFALGILPYINASIIMQLLTLIIPPLERLSKQGEEGRRKMTQITRYASIVLAIVQGIGIAITWYNTVPDGGAAHDFITPMFALGGSGSTVGFAFSLIIIILTMVAGSCIVMWLADLITEFGVGNGASLIIFAGILVGFASGFIDEMKLVSSDVTQIWRVLLYLAVVVVVFVFIIFIDMAQRNITVQYAKQVKGNKMYGGQSTHIPIKVNASGVMPIIFASSFLMFPQLIGSLINNGNNAFYIWWQQYLGVGTWAYSILMAILILFFSFFYAQIQFNPEDISKSIQQNGGFIPGIRPGRPTADYLRKINRRITLFGAIFLAVIALIPSLVFRAILTSSSNLVNAFSATGMLIVVSVALEFNTQLENQLMMKHYKGFLK
ncbi:MAG: preprotein translocase subunit SecY [Clostridia bacterium]|nr:preprotein translocase subunit SecY [Clostridia bacterium]